MLSLYPFAPSIINDSIFSPFDHLIDDDFGLPVSSRRYVLPRRRYVYRHSPYDLDSLIDHMAGLTAAIADDRSPADERGKGRRRSRSRNVSPRRTPSDTQSAAEEKTDVDMKTDEKTAEAPLAPPSSPMPQSATDNNTSPTVNTASASANNTADGQTNNTAVANTNTATTPVTSEKPTTLSPFRLIKELNGLRLTLTTSDTAYTVTTPIPQSISKSDLQLAVDNNVLTLSAQIKSSQTNANGKTESSSNVHISRSIRLDRDANTDEITAHVSEGQLTITIPRTPSDKKQTITIE